MGPRPACSSEWLAVHDVAAALHVLLHGQLTVAVLLVQLRELAGTEPLRRRRRGRGGRPRRLCGRLLERRLPVLVGQRLGIADGLRWRDLLARLPEAAGEVVLLGVTVPGLVALRPGRTRVLAGRGVLAGPGVSALAELPRELLGVAAWQALVPVPP